ncbi:MAG TPA: UbiA family prenyltransferase [candidate division Zixibacteria bacterium]|nr:UbiA family prenyltransferase [candidate division Zixibacteria bacterium]
MRRALAWLRLIHPAPAAAVTLLSAALGAILLSQAGGAPDGRWLFTVAAVAGSQVFTGAINDLVDRGRDQAAGRLDKPLAAGDTTPGAALWLASAGLALQLAASLRLGGVALGLGLAATASALAYNLWLSRTPLSVVPYVVSFSLLPLWVAAGVGVPLERVLPGVPLVGPFAAAAHLANLGRDWDADERLGSRSLAQVLGRRTSHLVAFGLALAVGAGIGAAFVLSGRVDLVTGGFGVLGLAAIGQGYASSRRLWYGMLLAAVCWTAAWGLATG